MVVLIKTKHITQSVNWLPTTFKFGVHCQISFNALRVAVLSTTAFPLATENRTGGWCQALMSR